MVYTFHGIFGLSDQGECAGWSMLNAWRRREFCTGFDEETKRKRLHRTPRHRLKDDMKLDLIVIRWDGMD